MDLKILKEHNKKRCVKEYRCRKCNKAFSRKRDLDDHMKIKKSCVTTKDDIHICKICGKAYTTDGNLRIHIKSCKLKNEEKAKKEKIKADELDNYIKEYNSRADNLSNFHISESIARDVKGGFSIPELDKIVEYLKNKDFDELVEFVIRKMHYSDNYKKCQNIRYIKELSEYIVYDGQWKNKSEKNISSILHFEVKFAMYLAREASSCDSTIKATLQENEELLDEYTYIRTQSKALKNVQSKYEERKK